ncbi:MAG: NfeD family protein [Opitutales bacterium]
MSAILLLIAAALVLVFFEILVPGGILGFLAGVCLIFATWIGFQEYGAFGGAVVFIGTLFAALLLIFFELKYLSKTAYGKKFFLSESDSGHTKATTVDDLIIGKQGKTVTRLNPTGIVMIENEQYEANSRDGYIESGATVEVAGKDSFKLIVKKP